MTDETTTTETHVRALARLFVVAQEQEGRISEGKIETPGRVLVTDELEHDQDIEYEGAEGLLVWLKGCGDQVDRFEEPVCLYEMDSETDEPLKDGGYCVRHGRELIENNEARLDDPERLQRLAKSLDAQLSQPVFDAEVDLRTPRPGETAFEALKRRFGQS